MTTSINNYNIKLIKIAVKGIHVSIYPISDTVVRVHNTSENCVLKITKQKAREAEKKEFLPKWSTWVKENVPKEYQIDVLKRLTSALLDRNEPDLSNFKSFKNFNFKSIPPLPEFMQK